MPEMMNATRLRVKWGEAGFILKALGEKVGA